MAARRVGRRRDQLNAQMAQWSMWFGGGDRDNRESGSLGMIGRILGIILLRSRRCSCSSPKPLARIRRRRSGAALSNDPLALASALRKMDATARRPDGCEPAVRPPLFIVQPLSRWARRTLRDTPTIAERIARLERMAGAELPAQF